MLLVSLRVNVNVSQRGGDCPRWEVGSYRYLYLSWVFLLLVTLTFYSTGHKYLHYVNKLRYYI